MITGNKAKVSNKGIYKAKPSKTSKNNPYMCVPISFTSWCMTSSMQQSGFSSATAALEAERFKR